VLRDLYQVCGLKSRLLAPLVGRYLYSKLKQEDARLKSGWTYQPPTFYELNDMARKTLGPIQSRFSAGQWIPPLPTLPQPATT